MRDHTCSSKSAAGVGLLLALLAGTTSSQALAKGEEEPEPVDARLENYPQKVALESASPAFAWFIFAFLSIVTLAVVFKNSARTHLD